MADQDKPDHQRVFHFWVDSKKFETTKPKLTGLEIKTLAGVDPKYQLFLEIEGDRPDELIADGAIFDFATHHGVAKFYAVPPATFGEPTGPFDLHFAALSKDHPGVTSRPLPSGARLITIPDISLPGGWSATRTSIRFIAPVGYPQASPDCFWADAGLRLQTGGMPSRSAVNSIPETTETGLWFSWHAQAWNPSRDTLTTYVHVVKGRFRTAS